MASRPKPDQLIVVVGPTASGKSQAALATALRHNGEIICADSRTVYKGLDIGTAKPSKQDRQAVRHHLLDVVEPDEQFSAAKFKTLALQAIDHIRTKGKLPIVVGGSGLFVDSLLFDYQFGAVANPEKRAQLERKSIEELIDHCAKNSIELPTNRRNKRHLIRAIEQKGINHKRDEYIREDAFVVGIEPEKKFLQRSIEYRIQTMFDKGVVKEATECAKKNTWQAPGLSGNIYQIVHKLVQNDISLTEAKLLAATADWQLARRQMTWFRRNKSIQWCESSEEAEHLIDSHLGNL